MRVCIYYHICECYFKIILGPNKKIDVTKHTFVLVYSPYTMV